MKKNRLLFALLLTLILIAPAVAQAQKMKAYPNKKDGYTISLPTNWTEDKTDKEISFAADFDSPDEDSAVVSMLVGTEALETMTNEEYFAAFKADRDSAEGCSFIKTGEEKLDGAPARYYVYRMKMTASNGMKITLTEKIFLVIKNHKAYKLIFISNEGVYARFEGVFQDMAKSFKVL